MKKYLWIGICLIAVLITASVVAQAQTVDRDLTGWAWGSDDNGGVGWVSFNGANAGAGGGNYKVTLKEANGALEGFAWSSNIGWIKFGGLTGIPSGGTNAFVYPSTGNVTGWVRACAGTASGDCLTSTSRSDGWDGWINLSGAPDYRSQVPAGTAGVTYVEESGNAYLRGHAWGSDVVGWLKFSPTTGVGTVVNPGGGNSITATCLVNGQPTSVTVPANSDVTYTLSGITGGTEPYSTYWNGSAIDETSHTVNVGSGGATDVFAVVTDSEDVSSESIMCPAATVASTATGLKLSIGSATTINNVVSSGYYGTAYSQYQAGAGEKFSLRWNINLAEGYTCSPVAPSTPAGAWGEWSGKVISASGVETDIAIPTNASGEYVFRISCTKASDIKTSSAVLTVRSSTFEEL